MKQITHAMLFSGGTDSVALLSYALFKLKIPRSKVLCLYIDIDSRQTHCELLAIKKLECFFKIRVDKIRSNLCFGKTNMSRQDRFFKFDKIYNQKDVDIIGRNLLFYSHLVNYLYKGNDDYKNEIPPVSIFRSPSEKNKVKILSSAYSGDKSLAITHSDGDKPFIDSLKKVIHYTTYGNVKLLAPFINKTKKQIVKYATRDAYHLSYSCLKGCLDPCAECQACNERALALESLL